jgi:hypothetical protein
VPITAIVVSSNSVHGVKYLIHHCVIMFVRDFRQVGDVLWVLKMVSSTKKTDSHVRHSWNIVESGIMYHNHLHRLEYSWNTARRTFVNN